MDTIQRGSRKLISAKKNRMKNRNEMMNNQPKAGDNRDNTPLQIVTEEKA